MEQPRGESLIENITNNVRTLSTNVQRLEQLVDQIGGVNDTHDSKEQLNHMVQSSNALSKKTASMLKELVPISTEQRQYRISRERLVDEYMSVLNRLQSVQRRAAAKEKAQIRSVTDEDEKLTHQNEPADDPLQQMQIQEQRRLHLEELKERHQALNQLETDINDVNMIFKDLARIVHDQGEMVDSIEANVEHATIHVSQGHTNVQQALHYQNKSRQKQLLILIFCCALVFILGLTLYLWAR
ncbi:Syntaxin-12 [Aphelenchoides besseyi]|nr:Syntaxin-12 [Aphelenchoides besseyi]KAI6224575.1 Syntaxin-12 [Aphelenchoides besseyi]